MTFLQPILLAGLPLMALPILIHLINRQRHRTIRWAAMMFLLDAKRMARGMAKLRHWLILAMRTLAIGALIFSVARPLASGWLGLAVGGRPDVTIIVLDRSASMAQQELQSGQSKRSTGLRKLAELIKTLGAGTRIVLIESAENRVLQIDSPDTLLDLPETAASATSADLPTMLQTALDYVVADQSGSTDIWICSDLRDNDWKVRDGRWTAIREGFEPLEGVRFCLLSYPERARDNASVWASNVRRRQIGQDMGLTIDVNLRRESNTTDGASIPLDVIINGARSVLNIDMVDREYTLQGHTIELDEKMAGGWGRLELPTDENPQDNVYYFVFTDPPPHHSVIVSDDRRIAELLRLALISPADPLLSYSATVFSPDHANQIDWSRASLVVWHAPLPDGMLAQQMRNFTDSGRPILFLPPDPAAGDQRLFGLQWGAWRAADNRPLAIVSWRGDSDLLRHARDGEPLPVGKMLTYRYRSIVGPGNTIARFDGGLPMLTRSTSTDGPAYFCATLPHASYSSLATDGVVFYVMLQRALSVGAATLGNARQLAAGSADAQPVVDWQSLGGQQDQILASMRPLFAGAYQDGEKLIALNRPKTEDMARVLAETEIDQLFRGLDYRHMTDRVDDHSALASEIGRAFLMIMAAALLVEAWLSVPEGKGE